MKRRFRIRCKSGAFDMRGDAFAFPGAAAGYATGRPLKRGPRLAYAARTIP
jgi:hypothetical protein